MVITRHIKVWPKLGQNLIVIYSLVILYSCGTPKKVIFEEAVDTSDRSIIYQPKKTYKIASLGVSVSNEFDGARLNNVVQSNDSTITIDIEPENRPINRSPYYAFWAWAQAEKTTYFAFNYPEGYTHRYWPKLRRNGHWETADSLDLYTINDKLVLKISLGTEPLTISAQEVVSSSDVRQWYGPLAQSNPHVHLKNVGKTVLGKDLPVLDIYQGESKGKETIVLLTRQHPPEITGYFAFQNFVEAILSDTDISSKFLKKYRIVAFPIMNPDGVDQGHWRHNINGIDLNRDWGQYRQPEIESVVKFIHDIRKKDKGQIILGLDFHSTYNDVFYTNSQREETTLPGFITHWFNQLQSNVNGYNVNEAAGNSTKPVSKGWFLRSLNATAVTYEIGDDTSKDRIKEIAINSANTMMEYLLQK